MACAVGTRVAHLDADSPGTVSLRILGCQSPGSRTLVGDVHRRRPNVVRRQDVQHRIPSRAALPLESELEGCDGALFAIRDAGALDVGYALVRLGPFVRHGPAVSVRRNAGGGDKAGARAGPRRPR